MPIDLQSLDQVRQRWIPMAGSLRGVELLVKHASPREQEKFRQRCARQGILKSSKDGVNIVSGRDDDFFRAYAEAYILDWRGDIKPEGTEYDPVKMGQVMGASQDAFRQVSEVIAEDEGFFGPESGG